MSRALWLALLLVGCGDERVRRLAELEGAWFTDEVSIGYNTIYDSAVSYCTARMRLELDGEALRLEESNTDCTAQELIVEIQACTAEVPVPGLLVGRGCTETTVIHDGGEVDVEEYPGAELRFYPVMVRVDQLQLGDQLLQRER